MAWRFIKRVERGVYVLPEDIVETYQKYRADSGEIKAEENQLARTVLQRRIWQYKLDVMTALENGDRVEDVLVPEGVPQSCKAEAIEKVKEKEISRRSFEKLASRSRKSLV